MKSPREDFPTLDIVESRIVSQRFGKLRKKFTAENPKSWHTQRSLLDRLRRSVALPEGRTGRRSYLHVLQLSIRGSIETLLEQAAGHHSVRTWEGKAPAEPSAEAGLTGLQSKMNRVAKPSVQPVAKRAIGDDNSCAAAQPTHEQRWIAIQNNSGFPCNAGEALTASRFRHRG